jgi:hypothetical protein
MWTETLTVCAAELLLPATVRREDRHVAQAIFEGAEDLDRLAVDVEGCGAGDEFSELAHSPGDSIRDDPCGRGHLSLRAKNMAAKRSPWTLTIIMAASNGDLAGVKGALQSGDDVNAVDSGGRTALHQAACNKHVGVVEALLGAELRVLAASTHANVVTLNRRHGPRRMGLAPR